MNLSRQRRWRRGRNSCGARLLIRESSSNTCLWWSTSNLIRGRHLPANINRFAMRSIDMDQASTDDVGFTFVKMGPVAVVGFYYLPRPREWSGSKVHVKHGLIGPTQYKVPEAFLSTLLGARLGMGICLTSFLDRQRLIADRATTEGIEKNSDRLSGSHWMRAMQRDVDRFGDSAFDAGFPEQKHSANRIINQKRRMAGPGTRLVLEQKCQTLAPLKERTKNLILLRGLVVGAQGLEPWTR